MTDYYPKPEQRQHNANFLASIFPNGLPGSYAELLGGHDPNDKTGKDQMFNIMLKRGLIKDNESFIGVDINPVVLFHRMKDKPGLHPYPVIFGDIFTVLEELQTKGLTNRNGNAINKKVIAINFDIGKKALASPEDDSEWWTSNGQYLRNIIKNAWKYTNKVAFIGNFARDHGTKPIDDPDEQKRIGIRKGYLLDSILSAFNIKNIDFKNDREWAISSFEDYHCRGQMIYTRFVINKDIRSNNILFYDKNGKTKLKRK